MNRPDEGETRPEEMLAISIHGLADTLTRQPEKMLELALILAEKPLLWGVKDVARATGWSEGHIRKLCQGGVLPHIPGKEIKFFHDETLKALRKMQCGGEHGRRKRLRKMPHQKN